MGAVSRLGGGCIDLKIVGSRLWILYDSCLVLLYSRREVLDFRLMDCESAKKGFWLDRHPNWWGRGLLKLELGVVSVCLTWISSAPCGM